MSATLRAEVLVIGSGRVGQTLSSVNPASRSEKAAS
jgi:hypothetical protein